MARKKMCAARIEKLTRLRLFDCDFEKNRRSVELKYAKALRGESGKRV
jgi:hypothetical protein